MARPVVITRPLAQARSLAQQVAALGREAVVFPLLEILPLSDPAPLHAALAELDRYALVAFVSPNAIDAAFAAQSEWPRNIVLSVMGEGSRKALARHGKTQGNTTIISPIDASRTDSQTLLQALDLAGLKGKQVLVIRGESGRELLADGLRSAGAEVTQVAAYRRTAPALDAERASRLAQLAAQQADWIITSSEAVRNLLHLAQQALDNAGVAKMQQQNLLVPHARIAETAHTLGFQHVTLTGSGDESLLAALQSRA